MNRPPFALDRADRGQIAVLRVAGDVDVDTAWRLREELTTIMAEQDAIVEMSDVSFLDSTGLGVLVAGYRQGRNAGHRMAIASAPQRVLDILELTQLTTIFALYPDLDAATDGLLGSPSGSN
ncbi:STAS domain-containing protein [Actinocatenispora rupis]|uniref:Anti-sigma factor antagonist n=1 Tax=Actinocatenispora rupis TaxID=519421 RepID=A0A8J3J8U0_9ACTN|nr:STAS domain-containing protein [Actinocatenispora rupis]GID16103.1 anti-sigma-B factor antagonist [Actinocatenispora rupis]